jgi:hypothetical protein
MEPRLGRSKALVAIGRKLLITVWHILTKSEPDYYAVPEKLAVTFFAHAYRVGIENLPDEMGARQYVRYCLDLLGIGQNLTHFPWCGKRFSLPPSSLQNTNKQLLHAAL